MRLTESLPREFLAIFDSGVGGLSVLRVMQRELPPTPLVFFADQAHVPYGDRPQDEIHAYVMDAADFLFSHGARALVLACHTASATSLYALRDRYPARPIVGIEPAVKPAASATRSGVIGVLTTRATAAGALYQRVLHEFAANTQVITRVSPDLVRLVEDGAWHTAQGEAVIRAHVDPLLDAGVDQLVLACTHFPFMAPVLERLYPGLALVDPAFGVTRQTARVMPAIAGSASTTYLTTGDPAKLSRDIAALLPEVHGPRIGRVTPAIYPAG
jgi:glutamate racemase